MEKVMEEKMIGETTVEYNGEVIGTTLIDIVNILYINFGDTFPKYNVINVEDADIIIEGREVHFLENKKC